MYDSFFLHLGTSPAAEGFLARFLPRGATPPRPLAAARARARPRRRNPRKRVSPQSTELSFLLNVFTNRLATGNISCRVSLRVVLSDHPFPRERRPPRRRSCREHLCGWSYGRDVRHVHTPGTYTPPTGFIAMGHDTYGTNISFFFLLSARSRDFNLRTGRVVPALTTGAANSIEDVEAGCMPPRILLGS